ACGRRRDDARCGTEATVNRALPRYNPAMAPRPVMLAVALAVSACAAPGPRPPALAPDELLAASRSDPSASVDIVSRDAVFALDDAMRAFVARHVDGGARPGVRL